MNKILVVIVIIENKYLTFTESINKNILTPNEEDYIEMLYRLTILEEKTTNYKIACSLNIKPSSVTKMMKKLIGKNLVYHKSPNQFALTNEGVIIGERLLRRHEIIEEFLRRIGIDEDKVIEMTEKMEHTLEDDVLSKISELNKILKNYF